MESTLLTKERVSQQQLLFGEFPKISFLEPSSSREHEDFYTKGFAILDGVPNFQSAEQAIRTFLAHLDTSRLPLLAPFDSTLELAKVDDIPVCHDSVEAGCQGLHYDFGQPFFAEKNHVLIAAIGLYRTMGTAPTDAKTRIVFLPKLSQETNKLDREVLDQRLQTYVDRYGDGWKQPTPTNTHRLQLFARFLDAIYSKGELTHHRYSTMAQWFADGPSGSTLLEEGEFYMKCGIDLDKAEERITLQPGQLAIIDNMRCVHGRIGKREPEEIIQFMYGAQEASTEAIDLFVDWTCTLFSK